MEQPPDDPMAVNNHPQPHAFGRRLFLRGLAAAGLTAIAAETLRASSGEQPLNTEPVPDCGDTAVHVEADMLPSSGMSLTSEPWRLPGVQAADGVLHVTPAPVTILDKSESELTEHPEDARDIPVLPFDTSRRFQSDQGLQISGDFVLTHPKAQASFLIAETLPLTYDEFQFLPGKGVRLTVSAAGGSLELWDGQHHDPRQVSFALDGEAAAKLTKSVAVTQENGQLSIQVNGQAVTEPLAFDAKQSWLGLEAPDEPFAVTSLTVKPLPGKPAAVADMRTLQVAPCSGGLRSLAERKNPRCKIGMAVAVAPLLTDRKYAALVAGNFNIITTENALKPQFVQPQEGVFRTEELDVIMEYARRHDTQVHGHALVPNRSLPKWMRELPLSRVRQVMVDHITGVIRHAPGLTSVDVVNEALDGWGWRKDTIWYQAMGDQYIDIALEAAHEAAQKYNPGLILVVNDNSTDKAARRDEARFNLLRSKTASASKKGIRAAMGFEGHVQKLGRDEMSPSDLRRRMDILAQDNVLARVAEMDVTTHIGDNTTTEGLRIQAQQFGSITKVCIEAPNCIAVSMWGAGGKFASTAGIDSQGKLSWGSNLLWDKNLNQRGAAYRAVQAALR